MDQRWTKIRELFRAALDVDVKQRAAFLMEQCPDEHDIRERVESMLKAYDNDDTFLESPVANIGQRFASKKGHEALVGTRVGPYQIRRVIAQGGMGVVFEALDTKLEKIVALKMMNPALMQDMSFKLRFEQEAKTLAKLEDPHFVRVHALVEENHNTFIVMEYIHGITLAEHIRAKGTLSHREVARIGLQLLTALSKAHKQNIIHRDLKPSNIMLTRSDDGKLLVKVLDFGIAKNIQSPNTVTRTMGTVGTLYYMSPEQIRALPNIDHRTDIYSTGVTLYEALNGTLPFDITKDEFTIRKQIVEGRLHSASTPKSKPSNAVEQVLAKALEIDPVQRFQSADHMRTFLLSAIREYVPQEESAQQPVTPSQPLIKKRRVSPFALTLLGLLLVVPIVLYAVTGSLPFLPQEPGSTEQPLVDNLTPPNTESVTPSFASDTNSTTTAPADSQINLQPLPAEIDTLSQNSVNEAATEEFSSSEDTPEIPEFVNTSPIEGSTTTDTASLDPPDSSFDSQYIEPILTSPLQMGSIALGTAPPSNLIIDNVDFGPITLEDLTLTAEPHRFVVENREFGRWECSIDIRANESIERYIRFDQTISIPIVAMLPDTTPVRNASILIDGSRTGFETPMTIKVSPGLRTIGAQLDGYTQEFVSIEGAEGCFQKINSSINFDNNINYTDKRVIVILSKNE